MKPNMSRSGLIAALIIAALTGCGGDGAGYRHAAETANKAADRQAQQNSEMAKVNQTVAEGTKRLVEADAQTRKEIVAVHKDLQAERATLNEGFNELEAERKQIAQDRRTESILLPAAKALGAALVAVAVLGFCLLLLSHTKKDGDSDAELSEMLILDLVSEQPQLLHRPVDPPTLSSPETERPQIAATDSTHNKNNKKGGAA